MKNKLIAAAAVLFALALTACTENNTVQPEQPETATSAVSEETAAVTETTADKQTNDLGIETLAAGETRDWTIEDVLKNDLTIDGISITIPCTLNELLDTLGKDYSVKKSDIKDTVYGEVNRRFKDFTGEYIVIDLYCNGDDTLSTIQALIANPKKIDFDSIKVIGYSSGSGRHNGYLSLSNLTKGDSLDKCLSNYGNPNEIRTGKNETVYLTYSDDRECFIQIEMNEKTVYRIWAEFKTEELENN